jgi:hypothetical protein
MSSREHQLISRIIRAGALNDSISWGITPDDFRIAECKNIYMQLLAYSQMHHSVIGPMMAAQMFPSFQLCDDQHMQTPALCIEVRKNRLALDLQAGINDLGALTQTDPIDAVRRLQELAASLTGLTSARNTDVRLGDAMQRTWHKYQLLKAGHDFSLCPWPWLPIQRATRGIMPSDYIVFYGRPKSMKSWVLASLAAWVFEQDKRAIIYTKEMGADDIFRRIGSCIARVNATGLQQGSLNYEQEVDFYNTLRMIELSKASGNLITLSGQDCGDGYDTVPWLASKIEEYKPHFCFIDGMYLMSDVKRAKKDHERVMNISRALRQMTLQTQTALCVTLQANRKAAGHAEGNLDEIAFSDAIGQDATHIFRVINEKHTPTIALVTAGGREFNLNGWRIFGEPDNRCNFDYFGELTDKDIQNAKEGDTAEDGTPQGKRAQATTQPKGPRPPSPSVEAHQAAARVQDELYRLTQPPHR